MKWTTVAINAILNSHLPSYRESFGEDRKQLVRRVRKQIEDEAVKSGTTLPKDLKLVSDILLQTLSDCSVTWMCGLENRKMVP
jgi:hypothetical protein